MQRLFWKLIFSFVFLLVIFTRAAYSQDGECKKPDGSSDLQRIINACNAQIQQLGQKRNTLSSQIQYFNSQINLTQLQIADNEKKIDQLKEEVQNLSSRIEELDTTFQKITDAVNKKIEQAYKKQRTQEYYAFFSANNFPAFLRSLHYLQKTQKGDRNFLLRLQNTRLTYKEQKNLREVKEKELEVAVEKLQTYRYVLSSQQREKQNLIIETQNDEKKYQEIISQALEERRVVEKAIVSGTKVGPIKKGDPIALVGNSGYPYCSTGPHLHFEVQEKNQWINAENYLQQRTLPVALSESGYDSVSIGTGSWDWPLSDPVFVNQRYGKTPWSWRYAYSGGIHTGIDMESKNSEIIRAVDDGILYSSSQLCVTSIINIKYIEHANGLISLYLHVQ